MTQSLLKEEALVRDSTTCQLNALGTVSREITGRACCEASRHSNEVESWERGTGVGSGGGKCHLCRLLWPINQMPGCGWREAAEHVMMI